MEMPNKLYIFTDASNNKTLTVGTYLFLDTLDDFDLTNLNISHLTYPSLTSTIGELTVIYDVLNIMANKYTDLESKEIHLYTDCRNFINLYYDRQYKPNLIKHRNYEFYKKIIDICDKYKIKAIWTKGHDKKDNKRSPIQKIFSEVDVLARQILRYKSKN
jgi:hypothetical protein